MGGTSIGGSGCRERFGLRDYHRDRAMIGTEDVLVKLDALNGRKQLTG